MHNFRKLDIWIKSVNFVTEIYHVTESLPSKEKYGLISQLERASVSIPTNIAEGSAKTSNFSFAKQKYFMYLCAINLSKLNKTN